MLARIHPEIHNDPYTAVLAHRIAALHEAGVPVSEIVTALVVDGPLPAELPAAALWWRLSRHITPADATIARPNPSINSPHAGGMSVEAPAGAHDASFDDAAPKAGAAEDRSDEQYATPDATVTRAASVEAVGVEDDQVRHWPALQQSTEGRWRDWANQTNPALLTSEHWQAIASQLDRLNPAMIDFDRLGQRLGMFSAKVVLAMLKDHNDPDQADIRAGRWQHDDSSPSLSAHERHLRDGGHSRSADGLRR